MTLDADTILGRHPEASASRVGDETVILHLVSGTYFGLDPVATRIWELLLEPLSVTALQQQLLKEFTVTTEVLAADMRAFLDRMLEHEILVVAAVGGEDANS